MQTAMRASRAAMQAPPVVAQRPLECRRDGVLLLQWPAGTMRPPAAVLLAVTAVIPGGESDSLGAAPRVVCGRARSLSGLWQMMG